MKESTSTRNVGGVSPWAGWETDPERVERLKQMVQSMSKEELIQWILNSK